MKINEVENLLDISKANIRFYEKEGLLSPSRTAAGYRAYSQADVERLQTVLLLRKLGFPVKVIRQILDGTLPLDKALAENIAALEAEQARLKGALAMCRQMQKEQPQTLDVQRYWDAVQRQESGGDTFQSIAGDYLRFIQPAWDFHFFYVPDSSFWGSYRNIGLCVLALSLFHAVVRSVGTGGNFLPVFFRRLAGQLLGIALWCILLYIPYRIFKKNPKKGQHLRTIVILFVAILAPIAAALIFTYAITH